MSFPGGLAVRGDAEAPPLVWTFAGCVVREWPDADVHGYLETVWPDGTTCGATRGSEMYNLEYARHLGYAGVRDALREHELAHTFVSEALGFPYSLTLRAAALGFAPGCAPYEFQLFEEAVVLDFQRYLNTGEIGPALNPYRPLVPRWADEFRRRFCGPREARAA